MIRVTDNFLPKSENGVDPVKMFLPSSLITMVAVTTFAYVVWTCGPTSFGDAEAPLSWNGGRRPRDVIFTCATQ